MSSRNTPAASSREAANSAGSEPASPWNFLADLNRRQLALAAESMSALCRGSEALRGIQQDAAHEASVRHADMAQKLLEPCQPADLMSMQSELLRFGLQSASRYWQQLATQMMQTQVDMMSSVSHLLDSEKGGRAQLPLASSFFMLDPLAWTGSHGPEEKSVTHH